MDGEVPQNGSGNGKVYVKFGPGTTQEMPLEWASRMLSAWKENKPAEFGKYLAQAGLNAR
jgi:hypothetical protein